MITKMRFKIFSKTSVIISTLRTTEKKVAKVRSFSHIFRLMNYFSEVIRLSFKLSYVMTFFNFVKGGNPAILYNSKFTQWAMKLYNKFRNATIDYLNTSPLGKATKCVKEGVELYSFKAAGIILISAAVVNLILYFIFNRQLQIFGLAINGLFLLIGILSLFCEVDWRAIKTSSVILKALLR